MINAEGAAPPETAHLPEEDPNPDQGTGPESNSTSGDGAREGAETAGLAFVRHLDELGVPLFTAEPGGRRDVVPDLENEGELIEVILRDPNDPEFVRPRGWPTLTAEGNWARIAEIRWGGALCAICGKPIAVVDVDPRNGGDIENVHALLAMLKVRIFAEITTPGGGKHFYVAGHEDLPSTSWKKGDELADFPGVDIQSHGGNVFLPFTARLKYPGKGYTVEFDDLEALASADADAGEALARWVGEQLAKRARKSASAKDKKDYFDQPVAPPGPGASPTRGNRPT